MGGFIAIGISTPLLWKPGYEKGNNFFRIYWLFLEVVLCRKDFSLFRATDFASQVSDEVEKSGGYVTYYRKT